MATKAAWALAGRLVKWGGVASEGVNQSPSHLRSRLGRITDPSRWIRAADSGSLSQVVRQ